MAQPPQPPQPPQSGAELEEFFDLSIDLLCIVGFDGYFKRVNPALARTLGYPPPELFARSVFDITHPDDREPSREALAKLGEGHDLVGFTSRVVCADGSVRWLEWNTRSMPERGVVYGVARDATERRRAEAALRETQTMLESSRDELHMLAEAQAALRRVATLVAGGALPEEVFAAVGREAGVLLGADAARVVRYVDDGVDQLAGWSAPEYGPLPQGRVERVAPSVTAEVFRTGRPARMDDHGSLVGPLPPEIRALGIQSAVGAPIVVDGRLWGAALAWLMHPARLPGNAEARLAEFTELAATAVTNAAHRADLERVLAEQAALRRVATLVARETPPEDVFAAVVREVGEALGVDATHLGRYDADDTIVSVAQWGAHARVPIGARFPLDGDNVSTRVLRTGRPARMDRFTEAHGIVAATVRELGIRSSIGIPISVAGQPWGLMIASTSAAEPFPAETESRLQDFTELLAAAISNTSAHAEVRALADEQAALRRVATIVAREAPQAEVFAAIAEEIGRLLGVDAIEMVRYEDGRTAVALACWGTLAPAFPNGTRLPLGGRNVTSLVFSTGRAARIDDFEGASGRIAARVTGEGVRSAVGTPILAGGRLWGAMIAASTHDGALPPETESRIAQFTELMATAISNAEARAEVARLADEQAALRRVATLVAHGASPTEVFDAVTKEVTELLDASAVSLARYDDGALTVVAQRGDRPWVRQGDRFPLQGLDLGPTVLRTGSTARIEDLSRVSGPVADIARSAGIRAVVAAPIVVDGRTWGMLAPVWMDRGPPPEDTEERLARFAELLDTAIANADSRDQLTASRARVLAAADDARRFVVRDLHDGAQQRLVHTIVTLKLARQALRTRGANAAEALLGEALKNAEAAIAELRELSHGILPAVLSRGGLRAGVDAFASRLELPVDADVPSVRLPPDIEASAYFIVAEALTNVVKHAGATRAAVRARIEDGSLSVEVSDDGVGGADPGGYGLLGIADRVDALGGRLSIESGDRGGTVLTARLPLSS